MEAVKQGSACLGLVGKDGVVFAALKRQPERTQRPSKKLLKIDDHLGADSVVISAVSNSTLGRRRRRDAHRSRQPHAVPPRQTRVR